MSRLKIVTEQDARGLRRVALWLMRRRYGFIPGIIKVGLIDLTVGRHMDAIYSYLQLRQSSPLTRLQREMLAVVVNGHVDGAP